MFKPELVFTGEDGKLGMSYANTGVIAIKAIQEQQQMIAQIQAQQAAINAAQPGGDTPQEEFEPLIEGFDENDRSTWGNPGRNDLCPCGSGKKFKHCHGSYT